MTAIVIIIVTVTVTVTLNVIEVDVRLHNRTVADKQDLSPEYALK